MLRMLLALALVPAACFAGSWKAQVVEPPVALRATEMSTLARLGDSISLQLRGCAGEVVAGSFVVVPADAEVQGEVPSLQLQWTSLDGAGGPIDRSQVSVRVVKHWFQGGTAWSGIRADPRRVYVPELLLNDDSLVSVDKDQQRNYLRVRRNQEVHQVDVSEARIARNRFGEHWLPGRITDANELGLVRFDHDRFRQLWVDVTIPDDAKPGSYTGRLQFVAGGTQRTLGTIQLEVLPVELLAAPLEYAIYYRGKLSFRTDTISSEWKSPEQMLQELKDISAHQIENATIFQPDDRLELIEQVLSLRQQAGISNSKIYYLGFSVGAERTPIDLQRMAARVRRLVDVFKRYGATEMYFYGLDEATGAKLAGESAAWAKVREAGARIYAAGKVADADFLAAHANTIVFAYVPDREVARRIKGAGARVFSYANPQSGPENSALFRRNYGVELWRAGYDGALLYAYQSAFGAIYNDFDDPEFRDHVFAYPTSDGAIDTLAWEGMREAVTDVRYLATLEKTIDSFPPGAADPEVERARQFLQLVKASGSSDLHAMRLDAATLLISLVAKARQ